MQGCQNFDADIGTPGLGSTTKQQRRHGVIDPAWLPLTGPQRQHVGEPGEIAGGVDDDGNGISTTSMDQLDHGDRNPWMTITRHPLCGNDRRGGNNGIGAVCGTAKIMALKFIASSRTVANSDAIECFEYVPSATGPTS
jgi:hypothetical protein